jgi:hypothetical protein
MALLRGASFDNREAFGPFVLIECVQGDVEAIRFVAESAAWARIESARTLPGVDAQKFRIITSLLVVAQRASSVIVGVLDTLARRVREICQSKKTSVIGRILPPHRPSGNHEGHGQRASHISFTWLA